MPNFDEIAPTAWYSRGADFVQGGVQWNVGPDGHTVTFPAAFPRPAVMIEAKALTGGRAWVTKVPGQHAFVTHAVIHCEPPGGVAWKAVAPN
jgi:hypothetical protein